MSSRHRPLIGPKFCQVVGEERGLMAGAGDGNVAEAGVEQVRVDPSVSVNENAFGGEPLRAVTGDGISSNSRNGKRSVSIPKSTGFSRAR
jgi:hypothetical protein